MYRHNDTSQGPANRLDPVTAHTTVQRKGLVSHAFCNNIPGIRKIPRTTSTTYDPTHVMRARAHSVAASKPPNGRSVRLIYFLYFRFKLTDRARQLLRASLPHTPPVRYPALSIRDHQSFTNRECQSPRPPRGDSIFFPFFPRRFPPCPPPPVLTLPADSIRTSNPFLLLPLSLSHSLFFSLCLLSLLSFSPLAFLSVTETTDDRVSGRIFPMAVIAHAGETRLTHGELPLPFDGIVMRSSFSSRQISKLAAESCCIGAWGGESRID